MQEQAWCHPVIFLQKKLLVFVGVIIITSTQHRGKSPMFQLMHSNCANAQRTNATVQHSVMSVIFASCIASSGLFSSPIETTTWISRRTSPTTTCILQWECWQEDRPVTLWCSPTISNSGLWVVLLLFVTVSSSILNLLIGSYVACVFVVKAFFLFVKREK